MWYGNGIPDTLGQRGEGVSLSLSHPGAFKLFHLSVLYLAAHVSVPPYKVLGLPADRLESLRLALFHNEPPGEREWALFCSATRGSDGKVIQYIAPPMITTVSNCELVAMTYAGGEWYVALDERVPDDLAGACLTDSGLLKILVRNRLPTVIEKYFF